MIIDLSDKEIRSLAQRFLALSGDPHASRVETKAAKYSLLLAAHKSSSNLAEAVESYFWAYETLVHDLKGLNCDAVRYFRSATTSLQAALKDTHP